MTNEVHHEPRYNAEYWKKVGTRIDITRPQKLLVYARSDNDYRVSVNETFYFLNLPSSVPGHVQTLVFDYYYGLILVDRSARALIGSLVQQFDDLLFVTSRAKCEYFQLGKTATPLIIGFHSYIPETGPSKQNANWYAGHHLVDFYFSTSKKTELNFRFDLSLFTKTSTNVYQKQTDRIKKIMTWDYHCRHYSESLEGIQFKILDQDTVLESLENVSIPQYADFFGYQSFIRRQSFVETHREMFAEYPLQSQMDDYFGAPPFGNDTMS